MKQSTVSVASLMSGIQEDVRDRLRERLLERGGPSEYRDREVFQHVEAALRRAVDARDPDAMLLPDLVGDEEEWRLQLPLRFTSHRPAWGRVLIFVKRRLLLPMMWWLWEYSLENFRRQERANRILFACLEELAIDNARLRQDLERLAGRVAERP